MNRKPRKTTAPAASDSLKVPEKKVEPAIPNTQLISDHLDEIDKGKATLDWFGFETRIRNIVYELLNTPMETVKKMMDK
jgi:hypothetical protein